MKSTLFAIVLGIMVAVAGSGLMCAATPVSSFGVSATVQAACLVLASGVTFGSDTGGMVNATSIVSVNCTHSTPYNVSLSTAAEIGAVAPVRPLADVGPILRRYPHSSKSQATVDGGRMADSNTVAGTGNGSAQTLAVHGTISTQQFVAPAAFANTITVAVIY